MIGKSIDQYRIISALGKGGMGEVYLAEDTSLHRRVALKFLSSNVSDDEVAIERFRREARAAAALEHPNIVGVHQIGLFEGRPYIVMSHAEGRSLRAVLADGAISVERIVAITTDVGEALAAAHRAGIVHRDIKPGNIILGSDGKARVLDFGLAKVQDTSTLTQSNVTVGTAQYMSPEQVRGEDVDARSDIFSLGVMLYEMLAGKLPFSAEHRDAVFYGILSVQPPRPGRPGDPASAVLADVAMKAIEKAPQERFQRAEDMVRALRLPESSSSKTAHGRWPGGRKRAALLTLTAITVVVIAGIMVVPALRKRAVNAHEQSLAIADFTSLVDSEDRASVAGLSGLLQVGLVEASPIRVISPDYLHDLRRRLFGSTRGAIDEDQMLAVAEKAGATTLLAGQMGSLSGSQYVTWRLVDTHSGRSIGAGRLAGSDVASLADQVVSAVVPALIKYYRKGSTEEISSVTSLTTRSAVAYEHYMKGLLAASEARDEDAIRELQAAVHVDSSFALAYFELSRSYGRGTSLGDKCAEKAWDLRVHLGTKDRMRLEGWRNRNNYRLPEALSTYQEMLARWPDDHDALVELAREYENQVYRTDAVRIAEQGLKLYPDDLGLGRVYGEALSSIGRLDDALDFGRSYARRHPNTANAWVELGWRFASLGLTDSAEVYFDKALSVDSTFVPSRVSLCYLQYRRGNVDEAIRRCQSLLAGHEYLRGNLECDWQENVGIALMLTELGRIKAAVGMLDLMIAHNSESDNDDWIEITRARVWQRAGEGAEALRWARAWNGGNARVPTGPFEIAWAYLAMDSTAAARRAIAGFRASERGYALIMRREIEARIALQDGKPQEALDALADMMTRTGMICGGLIEIEYRETRARALWKLGRRADAAEAYREMLKVFGGHAISHYELGKLLAEMNRPAEARVELTRFLAMWSQADPGRPESLDARRTLNSLGS